MFGLNPSGFKVKTRDEIFAELSELAKSPDAFGSEVDLTPYSPLGIIFALVSESTYQMWLALEALYYGSYLDTAENADLDRLARFAGIIRKQPQKEQVQLLIEGTNSTIIPIDYIVQTPSGIQFKTTESKIITGSALEATVQAEAINFGVASRVGINQLNEFASPLSGIDSVSNTSASSGGSELESDSDFRARALDNINIFRRNTGLVEFIKRQIKNDPNIISCEIVENPSNVEVQGMPPHAMQFIIDGGSDLYVANLIRKFKPAAIGLVGNILVNVETENNQSNMIYFSRPGDYPIFLKLDLSVNSQWDNSNLRKIKSAIIHFIGGIDTYTESGNPFVNEYKGLGVGRKVSVFDLYPIIANFSGVQNLNLALGLNQYEANLNIIQPPSGMRAKIDTANILVSLS